MTEPNPTAGRQVTPPTLALGKDAAFNMKILFEHAAEIQASDILLTAESPPMVRVNGELFPALEVALDAAQTKRLIWSLITEAQQEKFERSRELDFSLAITNQQRFRVNIYYQRGTVAAAFRLVPCEIPGLESLGLPPVVTEFALRPRGLILVTGPTGSGKTTTMAAMIDVINRHRRGHVITIEDPIEFVHENRLCIIDQREVYADTLSFATALKYVLRQTPDVILVGEMRDMETIAAALTAAETGHLVIATLHTNDAVQSIDRIIDVFPPHHHNQVRMQLSFALITVISQRLLLRRDGLGRVLAYEILSNNYAAAALIREGKTHQLQSVLETNRAAGMITFDACLMELYQNNLLSREEVSRHVSSPAVMGQIPELEPPKKGFFHR